MNLSIVKEQAGPLGAQQRPSIIQELTGPSTLNEHILFCRGRIRHRQGHSREANYIQLPGRVNCYFGESVNNWRRAMESMGYVKTGLSA
jgi:hypothetical protein